MLALVGDMPYVQSGRDRSIFHEQPHGRDPEDLRWPILLQGNPDERPVVLPERPAGVRVFPAENHPRPATGGLRDEALIAENTNGRRTGQLCP